MHGHKQVKLFFVTLIFQSNESSRLRRWIKHHRQLLREVQGHVVVSLVNRLLQCLFVHRPLNRCLFFALTLRLGLLILLMSSFQSLFLLCTNKFFEDSLRFANIDFVDLKKVVS